MPRSFKPSKNYRSPSFKKVYPRAVRILPNTPELKSKGDRPLQMSFEDQLKALIFFHLEEHSSGRHLIQVLKEDNFAPEDTASRKAAFSRPSTAEDLTTTIRLQQPVQRGIRYPAGLS